MSRQLLHRETKTATSDATLPLPDVCAAGLKLRKTEEADAKEKARTAWQGGKLIFKTKWGAPIEPRNFNRAWDARCAKAGIRKITVHDGRRTCATLLVDVDVPPPPRGHANPSPRANLGDHGDLRSGIFKSHPGCVEAVGRQP